MAKHLFGVCKAMGSSCTKEKVSDEWERWGCKLDTRNRDGERWQRHMSMGRLTAWEGVSLLLEVWWGQNIAMDIEWRCP